ncbi:low-density lipoprotein receptor-related protein 6-like [Branchiostoma floridae x Branchiostoma belcheri]
MLFFPGEQVTLLRDPGSSNIGEPFLLVADRNGKIILQVNITSGSNTTLPLGDVGQPAALDHDALTDYVYWADKRNEKIHRARRDGSGRETILDISTVRGLALDHARGDIYWTDYDENTISVAKMDGSSTRTLLTSPAVSRPYDLVLDPRNKLMYWADGGNDRIARAAMDGSNQTTIITGVSKPRAVTIDYREDRLYYSDIHRMYSSDLLGNDIQLLSESGKWVYGIAVDENYVYWSSSWLDSSRTRQGKVIQVKLDQDCPGGGSGIAIRHPPVHHWQQGLETTLGEFNSDWFVEKRKSSLRVIV